MAEENKGISVDYQKFVEGLQIVFGGAAVILQSMDPAAANMIYEVIMGENKVNAVEPDTPVETEAPVPATAEPEFTREEVRRILSAKSAAGYSTEVKELLSEYGASKLSDVDPSRYGTLIAAVEKIGGDDR